MANVNNIHPGDKVQIKVGARDITNNVVATNSSRYIEGSSQWGIVESVSNFYGKTKVRVYVNSGNKKVVVWQVEPSGIADNIIHPEIIPQVDPKPAPNIVQAPVKVETPVIINSSSPVEGLFAPTKHALSWKPPKGSNQIASTAIKQSGSRSSQIPLRTTTSDTNVIGNTTPVKFNKPVIIANTNIGTNGLSPSADIVTESIATLASDRGKLAELLNDKSSLIQNENSFPKKIKPANYTTFIPASYDYRIETGNTSIGGNGVPSLEQNMIKVRSSLGLPVHGDNTTARYMKYFLYNRFKVPDKNLVHNKSFTHVFFTRPDLNILDKKGNVVSASSQCLNHTESAMIWMRNPALFKLLVDKNRCNDSNNFNMLLSNAITSFNIEDESISTNSAGKSWNEYSMQYGNMYTGRSSGEFSVNFTDLKDYSIIHLLKLWIIYIDNVARGAWSPSYNLTGGSGLKTPTIDNSHVYTKTLDYASSVYVFKIAEDGSDILYWSKYYGVFPVNTGASALSWDIGRGVSDTPSLNIRFKYSFKRDLSPISLIEFNKCAGISSGIANYESQFNTDYGHVSRPYSGVPFIQMKIPSASPNLVENGIDKTDRNLATLRLQFMDIPNITGFKDPDLFGSKIK